MSCPICNRPNGEGACPDPVCQKIAALESRLARLEVIIETLCSRMEALLDAHPKVRMAEAERDADRNIRSGFK